jgi:zinc transporter, ZIP family
MRPSQGRRGSAADDGGASRDEVLERSGLLVCWVTVPTTKVVGILGGFGAGAMIAAVSFDLLPEAEVHIELWQTGVWMLVGVAVFLLADQFVERRFGSDESSASSGCSSSSPVESPAPSVSWGPT